MVPMISTIAGSGTYSGEANWRAQLRVRLMRTPNGKAARISSIRPLGNVVVVVCCGVGIGDMGRSRDTGMLGTGMGLGVKDTGANFGRNVGDLVDDVDFC